MESWELFATLGATLAAWVSMLGLMWRMHVSVRRDIDGLHGEIAGVRGELHSEIGGLRGEIAGLRGELHGEIAGLRGELHSEIGGLRDELRGEIGGLRGELHSGIAGLRDELRGEIGAVRDEIISARNETAAMGDMLSERITINRRGLASLSEGLAEFRGEMRGELRGINAAPLVLREDFRAHVHGARAG